MPYPVQQALGARRRVLRIICVRVSALQVWAVLSRSLKCGMPFIFVTCHLLSIPPGFHCPAGSITANANICPVGYVDMFVQICEFLRGYILLCFALFSVIYFLLVILISDPQFFLSRWCCPPLSRRHLGLDDGSDECDVFGTVHCRYGAVLLKNQNVA